MTCVQLSRGAWQRNLSLSSRWRWWGCPWKSSHCELSCPAQGLFTNTGSSGNAQLPHCLLGALFAPNQRYADKHYCYNQRVQQQTFSCCSEQSQHTPPSCVCHRSRLCLLLPSFSSSTLSPGVSGAMMNPCAGSKAHKAHKPWSLVTKQPTVEFGS